MLRVVVVGGYEERTLEQHVAMMTAAFNVQLPDGLNGLPVVEARWDHGRWVADCPECKIGAESVDPDDLRMFCFNCRPGWRAVVLPPDHETIEGGS